MEILKVKHKALQKALNQLKSSLDDYKKKEYKNKSPNPKKNISSLLMSMGYSIKRN